MGSVLYWTDIDIAERVSGTVVGSGIGKERGIVLEGM